MATVTLGPGDQTYTIGEEDEDQNVNGNSGMDTIYGSSQDNRIRGNLNDDQLYGNGGNDDLKGNEGNDLLVGGTGEDVLEGNAGDDTLTGGPVGDAGDGEGDVFKFSFDVEASGESGWVLIDTDTVAFTNGVTQGTFSSTYEAFLNSVVIDTDGDLTKEWTRDPNNSLDAATITETVPVTPQAGDLKQEATDTTAVSVSVGAGTATRYYDATVNTYEWQEGGVSIESDDGNDLVTDFELGMDVLDFSDVTQAQFEALFSVTQDSGNTIITIDGVEDWSVTLVGVNATEADLLTGGAFLFGA
jgi:Ca2+-binding RTX toxin-like protein